MAAKEDLLIELGCEELPAGEQAQLSRDFAAGLTSGLEELGLSFDAMLKFITPRRLAVIIKQLDKQQQDRTETRRGPAVAAAYDAGGKPTPAALGFAKSCGLEDLSDVKQVTTAKGEYLSAEVAVPGKPLKELLPPLLNQLIPKLAKSRTMRWDDAGGRFIRPLRWLLLLCGKEVIQWSGFGLTAGRTTMGHRFYHNKPIAIKHPDEYEARLEQEGYVIAAAGKRKEKIIKQLEKLAAAAKLEPAVSDELMDELAAITEYPVAYLAEFEPEFLQLPTEVLQSVLTLKQRYIPLVQTDGKLSNKFIFIANIKSKDERLLVAGNQAVVRPRLKDADFFYKQDLQIAMSGERVELLGKVTELEELGSKSNKSFCCQDLAEYLATQLQQLGVKVNARAACLAAKLCKCDLTSLMVQEFPELQGIMGGYYLREQGAEGHTAEELAVAAAAISEHYLPRLAGDAIPSSTAGKITALADRADMLVGFFHAGHKPSGERDPFALRRAALGLARIMLESNWSLELGALLKESRRLYKKHNGLEIKDETVEQVLGFVKDRVVEHGKRQGLNPEHLDAVFYRPQSNLTSAWLKVQTMAEYPKDKLAQLVEMNKRLKNIIGKNRMPDAGIKDIDTELLSEKQEQQLFKQVQDAEEQTRKRRLVEQGQYDEYLVLLSELKPALDKFFDEVMVMDKDEAVKQNRLKLLNLVQNLLLQLADFSRINY